MYKRKPEARVSNKASDYGIAKGQITQQILILTGTELLELTDLIKELSMEAGRYDLLDTIKRIEAPFIKEKVK